MRIFYLEARCVCKHSAVKAAQNLPLVERASSKQDQSTVGMVLSIYLAPRPAGAKCTCENIAVAEHMCCGACCRPLNMSRYWTRVIIDRNN